MLYQRWIKQWEETPATMCLHHRYTTSATDLDEAHAIELGAENFWPKHGMFAVVLGSICDAELVTNGLNLTMYNISSKTSAKPTLSWLSRLLEAVRNDKYAPYITNITFYIDSDEFYDRMLLESQTTRESPYRAGCKVSTFHATTRGNYVGLQRQNQWKENVYFFLRENQLSESMLSERLFLHSCAHVTGYEQIYPSEVYRGHAKSYDGIIKQSPERLTFEITTDADEDMRNFLHEFMMRNIDKLQCWRVVDTVCQTPVVEKFSKSFESMRREVRFCHPCPQSSLTREEKLITDILWFSCDIDLDTSFGRVITCRMYHDIVMFIPVHAESDMCKSLAPHAYELARIFGQILPPYVLLEIAKHLPKFSGMPDRLLLKMFINYQRSLNKLYKQRDVLSN